MDGSLKSVVVLAVALAATACASSDSNESSSNPTDKPNTEVTFEFVNVLGPPGSAQGLQALMDLHESRHPGEVMFNNSLDLPTYLDLPKRLAEGTPPDVIQWMAPSLSAVQPLRPLNDFLELESQSDLLPNLYPEFVEEVTVDGKIYALPWEVIRSNSLIYNKRVFAAHGLNLPTTMDEFLTLCRTLKAAGVTPVGGYGLGLLLEDLLAGVMGPENFCNFVVGGAPDEAMVRNAIDVFAEVVDNYFDRKTLMFVPSNPTGGEVAGLMSDSIAMLFTGDWIPGNLEQLGWTPGVDFGLAAPPGTADLFYHGLLVLVIPEGAPHPQAALDFLDTAGSLVGHRAYFQYKDGNSARTDVDPSIFNTERRHYIEDLSGSQRRCSRTLEFDVWETPLITLTETSPVDKEAVVQLVLTRGKEK